MVKEKCWRCQEETYDLRVLWMACLADMEQDNTVPFDKRWIKTDDGPRLFYALDVCKTCRTEWIRAIAEWFFKTKYSYIGFSPEALKDPDGLQKLIDSRLAEAFRRLVKPKEDAAEKEPEKPPDKA